MRQEIIKVMAFPHSDKLFKDPDAEAQEASRIEYNELNSGKWIGRGWYFHGHLKEDLGYDMGVITNKEELPLFNLVGTHRTIQLLPDGVYHVTVHGVDTPCIGYFWSEVCSNTKVKAYDNAFQHGLICYLNDGDANTYARNQFSKKEWP